MAYQPRLTGVNLRVPGSQPTDVQRFIIANLDLINDEPGRDVDFQLGFGGLRRTEMVRIARRYNLDLDHNMPAEDMMPRMEEWFIQGRFPVPTQETEEDALLQRLMDRLTPDQLRDMAAAKEGPQQAEPDPYEDESRSPEDMSWDELRTYAKSLGMDVFQKSREDIINGIYALAGDQQGSEGSQPDTGIVG